jgi:hypothetical protein
VRGDKQKAAGKKERSKERKQQEKKARIHAERVPKREDPQVEAKKEIKARK